MEFKTCAKNKNIYIYCRFIGQKLKGYTPEWISQWLSEEKISSKRNFAPKGREKCES